MLIQFGLLSFRGNYVEFKGPGLSNPEVGYVPLHLSRYAVIVTQYQRLITHYYVGHTMLLLLLFSTFYAIYRSVCL